MWTDIPVETDGTAINERGRDAFIHLEVTSIGVWAGPCLCHRGAAGIQAAAWWAGPSVELTWEKILFDSRNANKVPKLLFRVLNERR